MAMLCADPNTEARPLEEPPCLKYKSCFCQGSVGKEGFQNTSGVQQDKATFIDFHQVSLGSLEMFPLDLNAQTRLGNEGSREEAQGEVAHLRPDPQPPHTRSGGS